MIDRCDGRKDADCLLHQFADGTAGDCVTCGQCGLNVGQLEQDAVDIGRRLQQSEHGIADVEDDSLDFAIQRAKAIASSNESGGGRQHQTHAQIDTIGDDEVTRSLPSQSLELDDQVDGYQIQRKIAAGGMGTVYLAQQGQPVRRLVALKLIKAGMDSQQVLARFGAEQQALAMMDHAGIAKVFDGGVTQRGYPYFAMEYVDGLPLTEYCDQHQLSIEQRLMLILQVCGAVQHAHQKGIIHRDLKPSNVLVAQKDGQPVVKVIDFGLAKALDSQLTDETTLTRHFSAMGTIRYMSPEQAEGKRGGADTRTDVYSLGIILFELLTGSTPLTRQQAESESTFQLLQRIRNQDPIRPSSRLISDERSESQSSIHQRAEASRLARQLRKELDWIVLKAIEPDRGRRYETVAALADDIQRYLNAEPIEARPLSARYRIGKFVSKYRVGVGVAVALVTLLVTATGVSTSLYFAANAARQRAERSEQTATAALSRTTAAEQLAIEERELARESERAALAQTKSSEQVIDFMGEVLAPTQPEFLLGLADPNEDSRSRGERMREELKDAPLVQAQLMNLVGGIYTGLGRVKDAEPLLLNAYEIRCNQLPDDDPIIADSLHKLAELRIFQGRNEQATELADRAAAIRNREFGPDDYRTLSSRVMSLFAQLEGPHMEDTTLRNKVVAAHQKKWEDVLARHRKSVSSGHIDLAKMHLVIGGQAAFLKDNVKALQHIGKAVVMVQQYNPDSRVPEMLNHFVRSHLALAAGDQTESKAALERALELGPELFGDNPYHPVMLYLRQTVGLHERDPVVAEAEGRETVAACREIFGSQPRTAHALAALGELLMESDEPEKFDEGVENLEEAISIYTEVLGPNSFRTGLAHGRLGTQFSKRHETYSEKAEQHLRQALAIYATGGIVDYSFLDKAAAYSLFALVEKADWIDREPMQPVIDNLDARLKLHPRYFDTRYLRGSVHRALGEYAKAAAQHQESLRIVGSMKADAPADQASWIRAAMWASMGDERSLYGPIRSELVDRYKADKAKEFALPLAIVSLLYPSNQAQLQNIETWLANPEPTALAAGTTTNASQIPEPTALAAGPAESTAPQSPPEASAYGSDALTVTRALLEYRKGNCESALQIAGDAINDGIDDDRNQILLRLIASLCHFRLDQPDAAQARTTEITAALIDQCETGPVARQVQEAHLQATFLGTAKDYRADQLDWVACQTLWREVQQMGQLRRLDSNTALRVNSLADEFSLGDESVTLREAITAANFFSDGADVSNSTPSEITFDPGLFVTPQTIRIDRQMPIIHCDLSISGPGANLLTIDAGGGTDQQPASGDGWRIFEIDDSDPAHQRKVDLRGMTITGGDHPSTGGAIRNAESLTLDRVAITRSAAVYGGGLASSGELVAIGCTFSGNSSFGRGGGGAINSRGGSFTNCTISGNTSSTTGGAIINFGPPHQVAKMTLTNCTLCGNTADGKWAGINSFASGRATLTMHNTIVMGAIGGNGTLRGNHNLFGDTVSTTGKNDLTDRLTDVDARLGPLTDNGGTTLTHVLLPGSKAIDAGDPNTAAGQSGVPKLDQRGALRVVDDPTAPGGGIDIGAVERQSDGG